MHQGATGRSRPDSNDYGRFVSVAGLLFSERSTIERRLAMLSSQYIGHFNLPLRPSEGVKKSAVDRERHVVRARIIAAHPIKQQRQSGVLFLFGRILLRFPRTRATVGQTRRFTRIQEYNLRAVRQQAFHPTPVTAFYHP